MVDFGTLSSCTCRYKRVYFKPVLECHVVNETGQKTFKLFHGNTFKVSVEIVKDEKKMNSSK